MVADTIGGDDGDDDDDDDDDFGFRVDWGLGPDLALGL